MDNGIDSREKAMKESMTLMKGDCLERMKEIPDGSVDMALCCPVAQRGILTYHNEIG